MAQSQPRNTSPPTSHGSLCQSRQSIMPRVLGLEFWVLGFEPFRFRSAVRERRDRREDECPCAPAQGYDEAQTQPKTQNSKPKTEITSAAARSPRPRTSAAAPTSCRRRG